ncbi:proline dehydrogenase [Kribbella antibiotica]|uniref:Proline dehydrogenase n=1 Tax=Kribbella antibiotica TaxID=190195 RepID=A0A4R4ZKF3_9ACTN|nr:proline dehydrogenase family protein [Kribbella antibiotica]TDD59261.1 proline dehydrogenase [Kribbella antibiotica]
MRWDRAVLFKLATNERLEQIVKELPGGEEQAWRAASRYVAGRTRDEALQVAEAQQALGHGVSIDLFGELSIDAADADRVVDEYLELAKLTTAWLSLDLSHLAVDVDPAGAADRVVRIAEALPAGRRLQIGAEDIGRTDRIRDCVLTVAGRGLGDQLGATVQANLKRSPDDIDALAEAGVQVRLVKGAYVEPAGAHPYGEATDVAYLRLAHQLAERGADWSLATHDGRLREAVLLALGNVPVEQLLGIRPEVLAQLHEREIATRVYVPYGPAWFRYWLRRVAESRGA